MHFYDPQSKQKDEVSMQLLAQAGSLPFGHSTRFCVNFLFMLPIPASSTMRDRNLISWYDEVITKPDIDNLVKFYLDAANDILWKDDAKIYHLSADKIYSENPKTIITVTGTNMDEEDLVRGILKTFNQGEFLEMISDVEDLFDHHYDPCKCAYIISKLSEFGPQLSQVHKKYPEAWKHMEKEDATEER